MSNQQPTIDGEPAILPWLDNAFNTRRLDHIYRDPHNGDHVACIIIPCLRTDHGFVPDGRFIEVYVKCDLEVAKRRDPKGLYAKALAGEIQEFTGVSSPYEEPEAAELVIESDLVSAEDAVEVIVAELAARGIVAG